MLSIFVGVLALNFPLRPIHLSLLSWFTIGIPAFFLALEPNSDRVHPGFLVRVRPVRSGVALRAVAGKRLSVGLLRPPNGKGSARGTITFRR